MSSLPPCSVSLSVGAADVVCFVRGGDVGNFGGLKDTKRWNEMTGTHTENRDKTDTSDG